MVSRSTDTERQVLLALLKRIRVDAGLTQVELAERLSRPQSFVSKYESGERRLDVLELRAVCRALGVNFVELCVELDQRLN